MKSGSEPRTTTAIRFPPDLHYRLAKEALRRDVSLNTLVTWACDRAVVQWEAQDLEALLTAQAVMRGES
jgi:predicted HicB family RNase H-like nuclease